MALCLFLAWTGCEKTGSDRDPQPNASAGPTFDASTETGSDDVASGELADVGDASEGAARFAWVQVPLDVPRVRYLTFESGLLGTTVGAHVFVPAPYDRDEVTRFPVLYWLHGSGGGRDGVRPLTAELSAAMQRGQIAPFLIVFVESPPLSLWVDAVDGDAVESVYVTELVPWIDEQFRTVADPSGRWLEGFSMGGFGALRYAFLYPDVFGHVRSLGAGPLSPDLSEVPRIREGELEALLDDLYGGDLARYTADHPWTLAERHVVEERPLPELHLAIGALDNSSPNKVRFHEHLVALGVPHEFTLVPAVRHAVLPLFEGLGEARWSFYPTR
jgi:S-formylglutathione hydrolase FrmB